MVQVTVETALFCEWLLNISWQALSTSQRNLVLLIQNAATTQTPVSLNDWSNFNKFTAWRYPFYEVYSKYAVFTNPDLQTDLIAAWTFEGNSQASNPAYNGTDYSMAYGLAYGRILQGAYFAPGGSGIYHAAIVTPTTYSVNFWFNYDPSASSIFSLWTDGFVSGGFFLYPPAGNITWYTTPSYLATAGLTPNTWYMVTAVTSPAGSILYVNGAPVASTALQQSQLNLTAFSRNSAFAAYAGSMDAPAVWGRVLTPTEIAQLYNMGNGIQYPY